LPVVALDVEAVVLLLVMTQQHHSTCSPEAQPGGGRGERLRGEEVSWVFPLTLALISAIFLISNFQSTSAQPSVFSSFHLISWMSCVVSTAFPCSNIFLDDAE